MGVTATDDRRGARALAIVLFLFVLAVLLLLFPGHAGAGGAVTPPFDHAFSAFSDGFRQSPSQPAAAPAPVAGDNAAGRFDTVVLRDLGKRSAAVVTMVAENGSFTPQELWRSKAGKFNVRKAKFLAADLNADGITDGVALLDLGRGRSRFVVFLNDGEKAVAKTAWTSKKGAFACARAKLAVGDADGDGRDDVFALYDRGGAGTVLYTFISSGARLKMATVWTGPRSILSWAGAQLTAGDFTGDGRCDALVLSRSSATSAKLSVFVASASGFTKTEFWTGEYAAGNAQLGAGDVDSDGDFDAVCLYRKPDNTGRLDVFTSEGTAFSAPSAWYDGAALPGSGCRFAVGDVTGEGRADVLIARPSGSSSCSLTTCVSTGTAFSPQVWWTGAWTYAKVRLACSPSLGTVISEHAETVDSATLEALQSVSPDGTLAFDSSTAQLDQLQPDDVLVAQPRAGLPKGLFRKVVAVSESGGEVTVTTTQAALDDVILQGEIAVAKHVTPGDLSPSGVTQPGVRLVSKREDPLIRFAIKTSLAYPGVVGPGIDVAGSITLDPIAYFNIKWTLLGGIKSVSYTQILNASSSLDAKVMGTLTGKLEKKIFEAALGVIPVGPIWVQPTFTVYVGVKSNVSAGVTAGVTETVSSTVNLTYCEGKVQPPTSTCDDHADWRKPRVFGSDTLELYAGAGLSFLICSVAGPEAKLEPALLLEADTSKTPWWGLYVIANFKIGFTLDLRVTDLEAMATIELYRYRIDWARTPWGQRGVSGRVTDAGSGAPISGATVELRQGSGDSSGAVWGTTTSATDGTYAFAGPPAGDYTLVASKSPWEPGQLDTTVFENAVTEGQDIALSKSATPPGSVNGVIRNAITNAPIAGAMVEVRQGADDPFGTLLATDETAANGIYDVGDVRAGKCTVVARKAGFDPNSRTTDVIPGASTGGVDILLAPTGQHASMRSAQDGHISWSRPFDNAPDATFELWFRPTDVGGVDYGSVIAQISRDYPDWMGGGLTRLPVMQIQYAGSPTSPVAAFWINEDIGDDRGQTHRLTGTTPLLIGVWHHIAVQYGSLGMKLYVDGHLEASNAYTKRPEANRGADAGGWFSLGDNDTLGSGYMSAVGDFRGLRVSIVQRYPNDFLPQDTPVSDGLTTIYDALAGTTNGENVNFVSTPTTP